MRASSWLHVEPMIHARAHLLELQQQRIEITVGGQYLGRNTVDQVAPAIRLELRNQIQDLEQRLRRLGVTID